MDRYDDPTTISTPPALPSAGTPGYPTDGEVGVQAPTVFRAWFLGLLTEEMRNVVVAGGLTPSRSTQNQMALAIQAMVAAVAVPSGSMTQFGGPTAPAGWLECNGASIAESAQPALYAAIGTTYGSAGSGFFNLPDMRGQFARGWDHGAGVDPGRALGSTQTDQMQGFAFAAGGDATQLLDQATLNNIASVGGSSGVTMTEWRNSANAVARAQVVSDGTNGTPRVGLETRPKSVAVMYIIKT